MCLQSELFSSKWDDILNKKYFTEDLHGGFSVRVEGWLHLDVLDADTIVEGGQDANKVSEAQIVINNKALDLMELSQVSTVQRFITEDTVDGEEFAGAELIAFSQIISKHLQIPRGNGCSMGA